MPCDTIDDFAFMKWTAVWGQAEKLEYLEIKHFAFIRYYIRK